MNNRTKTLVIGAFVSVLVIGTTVFASGSDPGSTSDPLVTKSYVDTQVNNNTNSLQIQLNDALKKIATLENRIMSLESNTNPSPVTPKPVATALAVNVSSDLKVGSLYTITGSGSSPNKVLYKFWLKDESTGKWIVLQEYSEKATYNWQPTKAGKFIISMYVKDINSSEAVDQFILKSVEVKSTTSASTGTVTTSTLNVRSGPSVSNSIVGTLSLNTVVSILQNQIVSGITWYQIRSGTLTGWVHGGYIRI